ncbi:hypothetical protein [Bradyrhizobium sp. Leo170]|uniref:hypothetical protein n=1 Tax=Bradyrhizobium sp. Leo170 TaxID=1571199 RepID=UPI0013EECDE7|nr:hypothetical protein [Bradyrhizobium sp. Leo170]
MALSSARALHTLLGAPHKFRNVQADAQFIIDALLLVRDESLSIAAAANNEQREKE